MKSGLLLDQKRTCVKGQERGLNKDSSKFRQTVPTGVFCWNRCCHDMTDVAQVQLKEARFFSLQEVVVLN